MLLKAVLRVFYKVIIISLLPWQYFNIKNLLVVLIMFVCLLEGTDLHINI